jgi:hypothetical protein
MKIIISLLAILINSTAHSSPSNNLQKFAISRITTGSEYFAEICSYLQNRPDQLIELFSNGKSNSIPKRNTYGCILGSEIFPNFASQSISKILSVLWTGKIFDAQGNILINKFPFLSPIHFQESGSAFVYKGRSALDGAPAIILDYSYTNDFIPGFNDFIQIVRDEMREIAPGIFLGTVLLKIKNNYHPTSIYFLLK